MILLIVFSLGMDRTDFADKENMAPQQQQLQQQQQQQMLLQQQQVKWVVEFSREGTNLERFLTKHQYPQRKLLYFVN